MKSNEIYKRALNQCVGLLLTQSPGKLPLNQLELAGYLNVSRTTARAVCSTLRQEGILRVNGRQLTLLRRPASTDGLRAEVVEPMAEQLERQFMAWMVGPDCQPDQTINALDLARRFGVSVSAVRDCLNRFSNYGLLVRQGTGRFRVLGLTSAFVAELFDMREVMEFRAVDRFLELPPEHPAWIELDQLEASHLEMIKDIDANLGGFSELDHKLHQLIYNVAENRFFMAMQGVMSMIFHYHYQWNKREERTRNIAAIHEHLDYIAGLKSRNADIARAASRRHLITARRTLLSSLVGTPE